MRYMYKFKLGQAPLDSQADVLPFPWIFSHLSAFRSGLPFSLTLIAILLAHEFGHYFACRAFGVRATLPYLLPAPSLSGSLGAVIRLRSRVRSRAALITIGAMGPISGFAVALATVTIGLSLSHQSPHPLAMRFQTPLIIGGLHALLAPGRPVDTLVPHPVLLASWMGLLITALNLIPAGQLDGGHILYAISPAAHRLSSRIVVGVLFFLGIFFWVGWIFWGMILMVPAMRHPAVPDERDLDAWHLCLAPVCLAILVFCYTYQPFEGYSLLAIAGKLSHHF
jgi:membrane-associated protease RseP (regulator of RpoE activity)